MSTPKSVIDLAKKSGAKMVDIKFVDTFGTWQHFSCPIRELTEEIFEEGLGFDGSSIRGWKSIEASDMLAMPDPDTAFIDPFCMEPTLSLTCTIAETGTKESYVRDPRGMAQRAEKYLTSTVWLTPLSSVRSRIFHFDNVQFDSKSNGTFYSVDSEEAIWNSGRDEMPNLGYKIRHKEGYFPVAPSDQQQDIRTEMCLVMEQLGVNIERQHHEVATAGQAEIDYRFDYVNQSGRRDDGLQIRGQEHRAQARQERPVSCPKPLFGDNGSGMHTPSELVEEGQAALCGQ
jgi:glutamine synthetase